MLPLFTQPHIIAMPPTNEKSLTLTMVGLESPICYGFLNQKTSVEKEITNGLAAAFKKCYFIRLVGTKEGQECASLGHLENFSMSLGERQRKSRGT